MSDLAVATLSRDEARSLTDEVKLDAERLWRKLVELYEGQAHAALGYSSWGAYFEAEFGGSRRRGYELLNAGKVLDSVRNSALPLPANEAQANELAPLLAQPESLRDTWAEVVEPLPARPAGERLRDRRSEERRAALTGSQCPADHLPEAHGLPRRAADQLQRAAAEAGDQTRGAFRAGGFIGSLKMTRRNGVTEGTENELATGAPGLADRASRGWRVGPRGGSQAPRGS